MNKTVVNKDRKKKGSHKVKSVMSTGGVGEKKLKVRLVRSTAKKLLRHKMCVKALGLRKINQIVIVRDIPEIRGLINRVKYLLEFSELSDNEDKKDVVK